MNDHHDKEDQFNNNWEDDCDQSGFNWLSKLRTCFFYILLLYSLFYSTI